MEITKEQVLTDKKNAENVKCSKEYDMFANNEKKNGYTQCQVHLRDSNLCER